MAGINFNLGNESVSPVDLQYGIMGMESTWGTNTIPRYEPKYHSKLLDSYNSGAWVPTPAEKRVITERGLGAATKQFSTSYGPYQILPETAYRYTSFAGKPEDLEDPKVALKVYTELITRMHKKSGGDLGKAIGLWNQNPEYLSKMMNLIRAKKLRGG